MDLNLDYYLKNLDFSSFKFPIFTAFSHHQSKNNSIGDISIEMVDSSLSPGQQQNNKKNKQPTYLYDDMVFHPKYNLSLKDFITRDSLLGNLVYKNWLEAHGYLATDHFNNQLLDNIKPIKIGVYSDFFPIGYLDDNGHPAGFEVELLREIFSPLLTIFNEDIKSPIPSQKLYQFVAIHEFDRIWSLPDQIDLAAGGIADSLSRITSNIYWTNPHFKVKRSLVFLKSDRYLSDLKIAIFKDMKREDTSSESTLMTKLAPSSKVIATYGSTGWCDAERRLADRQDVKLLRGTTDVEDIECLLRGEVNGIMRGDNVAKCLVATRPNQLDYMYAWDIVPGIARERFTSNGWLPTETFCFPTHDSDLKSFIDLRVTQLTDSYFVNNLCIKYGLI